MATPICSLCRNVGGWLIVVVGCLIFSGVCRAQVPNETCATAMIPVQGPNGPCLCGGVMNVGWFAQEVDMSSALASFPYPTSPSSCQGYTSTVAAPAADVWYLYPYWFGIYTSQCITCTDTCHVSFWSGTCDSLQPGGVLHCASEHTYRDLS